MADFGDPAVAEEFNEYFNEFVPGYWMNETSGVLRSAVESYLAGGEMSPDHIAAMRAYLRQWIAGRWVGRSVPALRDGIDGLTSREAIASWICDAAEEAIDPL